MGAAGGVGADQCLSSPSQVFGELGQGELGGSDVITRGVLLLGVCEDEHAVDVHDHAVTGGRTVLTGQLPYPLANFGSRHADRGERLRPGCGEDVDEPGDRGL
ncbi:hypothetical protein GCM10027074_73720 [Streptomyces deserti]